MIPLIDLYRKVYGFNLYERDKWVELISESIDSGTHVLDIGAGSCPYRKYFNHCIYKTHDFGQLQPEQLRGGGYGAIDYVGDILSIPVPPASFDVILCTEVLEHTPEPIKVIQEFSRILKPGGKLILTAPLGSGLHQVPYHYYGGFTPYWYRHFLRECDFEKITIEANGGFFKFFGQECVRFNIMLLPSSYKGFRKFLMFMLWPLSFLIRFVFPIICFWLDSLDTERKFTVGYHVLAEKK